VGAKDVSFLQCPGGSGPTQPSGQLVLRALSPRVLWLGHGTDHLTSASTEVQNEWIYISTPPDTINVCTEKILPLH